MTRRRVVACALLVAVVSTACGDDRAADRADTGIPVPEHHELDLAWDPGDHVLSGTESVTVRNDGPGEVSIVWLRLWPNGWKWDRSDDPGGCEHPPGST